jgi:photosystem II stability/assembly factor-like uncharacterized protein
VLLSGAFLAFVLCPVPLYPHHLRVGRFSVYSDRAVGADVHAVIDEVERAISCGGLDHPDDRYRVFLSHDPWKYEFFCAIVRRDSDSQALVFSRSRSMIMSVGGIDSMRERTGGRPRFSRLEGSLAFAIAHEAAHIQVENEIRRRGLSRPPTWLIEGLADRTAAGGARRGASGDGLADRARLAFDREAWRPPLRSVDQRHFRWQVLVDYLADVRGARLDELLAGHVSEAATERDLREWMAAATVGAADREEPRSSFDGPDRAYELFLRERLSDAVPTYPINRVRETLREVERREERLDAQRKAGLRSVRMRDWREIGPGNIGGRTRALAIDPLDPQTVYAGGVSGGVWKSVDAGESWSATDDLMANLAVTTIVIDPVDPRTLYAGTGEGFFWPYSMARGLGVFKSTDAGETWVQLEGTVAGVAEGAFHYVHDLEISPLDHQRVYAATQFGVWRSDDGGRTWTVVLANPRFISGSSTSRGSRVGCTDIAIRAGAGVDILLAAFGTYEVDGLYRSPNGGDSWTRVLTSTDQGRMTVAFAPSDADVAYVSMAANTSGTFGKLVDVFRSTDGGVSWTPRVDKATRVGQWLLSNAVYATGCARDRPTYHQGWYDNVIAVDPVDPDTVWVGGIDLYRSDDGGRTFHPASLWWAPEFQELVGDLYVHADHHVLVFHPWYDGVTNQTLYSGNDGGVYRTDNARAATTPEECPFAPSPVFSSIMWRDLNNGYGVTQFYHGDSARHADTIVGGTQDNGTVLVDGPGRPDGWRRVWRGDGGYVAFDPRDDNVFYVEEQGFPTLVKTVDGGRTFVSATAGITDTDGLFIVPLAMDPSDPDVLWTGGSRPWRTTDGAASWTLAGPSFGSEISAIAVAPIHGDVVYVGLNTGRVWTSMNALSTSPDWVRRDADLPPGWVTSVAVDPVDPMRAYLTISTFDMPHVYRTDDGGATWRSIDGVAARGIPDIPCHWIAVRACDRDQLFVGSELGVFASEDGGETWEPANAGLAHTVVEALDFKDDDTLVAFTRGRGAFITELAPCGTPAPRRPTGRRGP